MRTELLRDRLEHTRGGPRRGLDRVRSRSWLIVQTAVAAGLAWEIALLVQPRPDQAVVDLAHRMGIEGNLNPYPALVLGTEDVTPLEMAGAYSTFANDGRYLEPSRLQATRSALGAIVAVGSICNRVSCRTTVSRSVGRCASSSCARIAMRRACALVSRCTESQ